MEKLDALRLRPGLTRVNDLPQRYKKVCRESGKVRWVSERDALIAVRNLGNTGSCYACPRCLGWHVSHYPDGAFVSRVPRRSIEALVARIEAKIHVPSR